MIIKSEEKKCVCWDYASECRSGRFVGLATTFICPIHGPITFDARSPSRLTTKIPGYPGRPMARGN